MERKYRALDQAEKEIPVRWYENRNTLLAVGFGVNILLFASGAIKLGVPLDHAMGGLSYILSAIADNKSTIEGFKANDRALQVGSGSLSYESNPLTSFAESANEYIAAKTRRVVIDGIGLALSAIIPTAGIGFAVSKTLAAMSNRRNERRIDRAIEIATAEFGEQKLL